MELLAGFPDDLVLAEASLLLPDRHRAAARQRAIRVSDAWDAAHLAAAVGALPRVLAGVPYAERLAALALAFRALAEEALPEEVSALYKPAADPSAA
jgi:hypothetical protein